MNTFKLYILCAFFVLTFSALSLAGIVIDEDSNSSLHMTITPDKWTLHDNGNGILPVPDGAAIEARTGGRAVPYYRRLIALPSNIKPTVKIESQSWSDWSKELPYQGELESDNNSLPHLSQIGSVYIGEPYQWRRRWVAPLYVMPLQIEGSGSRRLQEMQLRINYQGAGKNSVPMPDGLGDIILSNKNAARNWSIPKKEQKLNAKKVSNISSFSNGDLIKIELEQEGIYAITYDDLESSSIDLSGFDPKFFKIFGNGGFLINEDTGDARDSTFHENAILIEGEEDGSWDEGDRILFYARDVNGWQPGSQQGEFNHVINPYTRTNVLFLVVDSDGEPGKRMDDLGTQENYDYTTNIARSRIFNESENFIYHNSSYVETGRNWYASELTGGKSLNMNFQLNAPVSADTAVLWISSKRLAGSGENNRYADIYINSTYVSSMTLSARTRRLGIPAGILRDGSNTLSFEVLGGSETLVHFDWYEINYNRVLTTSSGRLDFDRLDQDGVAQISLDGLSDPYVFDVYDYDDVKYIKSSTIRVNARSTYPRRYIAVDEEAILTPSRIRRYSSTGEGYPDGLRDPNLIVDYIYITHEDFIDEVRALESYVEQRDNVEVLLVDIKDVFLDFSWGLYDPVAIRDFLKYAVENYTASDGGVPSVCLLIGDGDYDYRNISSTLDKNWIPPYENNLYCLDDFYAEFADVQDPDPELIMGRLPFQTANDVESYVERLIAYESDPDFGPWRSKMIVVADDEYVAGGPTTIDRMHMNQAEALATHSVPEYVDVEKIFIGTYPTSFDPQTSGRLKPLATRRLLEAINDGALMITYVGHGNAHVWAHEQLFVDTRDLQLVDSGHRELIYVAGTCSWGHFDRPANEAMFEALLEQPGGSIGVIASTRNTSGSSNEDFLENFFAVFFDRENPITLGEALLYTKVVHNPGPTTKYYHCFAEPMMMTALPRQNMQVTNINPDSLVSLEIAEIDGKVTRPGDIDPIADFDGEALVTVYDSYDTLTYTFTNSDGSPSNTSLRYRMPGGILFRGIQSVTAGITETRFFVPRDVSTGSNDSWIQLFADDGEIDAMGAQRNVAISTQTGSVDDNTPPEIGIYFDHRGWQPDDVTSANPTLIVDLSDESGLNLTGEIGHAIMVKVNGNDEYLLTDQFVYDRDSYTAGTSEIKLYDLEPGLNYLEVWAWDNANNFALKETSFQVSASDNSFQLMEVYNVPNPFKEDTEFTFVVAGEDVEEGRIKIYTASGRHIKTIGPFNVDTGFNSIQWDGLDQYGDQIGNGVYLYKLKVNGASGSEEVLGKLLRVR